MPVHKSEKVVCHADLRVCVCVGVCVNRLVHVKAGEQGKKIKAGG